MGIYAEGMSGRRCEKIAHLPAKNKQLIEALQEKNGCEFDVYLYMIK